MVRPRETPGFHLRRRRGWCLLARCPGTCPWLRPALRPAPAAVALSVRHGGGPRPVLHHPPPIRPPCARREWLPAHRSPGTRAAPADRARSWDLSQDLLDQPVGLDRDRRILRKPEPVSEHRADTCVDRLVGGARGVLGFLRGPV